MATPTGANPTINEIVKCITDGEYRIPRFQRDFVWDIKKSASLLDSIFKGFPISSVILWKTKKRVNRNPKSRRNQDSGQRYRQIYIVHN